MSHQTPRFRRVARAYRLSPGAPVAGGQKQRDLYGLYRQATDGDINVKPPGFFQFEDRLRYRAWKANRGMPREEARQRFVELAEELGFRDPGEAPVPWISDETWLREESWTIPDYDERLPCIDDPRPVVARDFDRDLAPTLATANHRQIPPAGSLKEHRQRLSETPKTRAFHIYSPRWPICCERTTTLVGFRGIDEDVADVLPEVRQLEEYTDEQWARGATDEPDDPRSGRYKKEYLADDLALYHCSSCGSVYLAKHES